MPKERFHILLADQYLKRVSGSKAESLFEERFAFFLGSVSPDIFFYDLPFFLLGELGDRLHALMEREGTAPIHSWLTIEAGRISRTARAWAMGFVSHFLADSIWHPVVNEMALSQDFCSERRMSPLECHRLIESEMEAFWLSRMGDRGGYVRELTKLAADRDLLDEASSTYRDFLRGAGLVPAPSPSGIRRCFLSQNRLLRLFSSLTLGRKRDRLLNNPFGRYLGSLVVPAPPAMGLWPAFRVPAGRDPFSGEFMEEGVTSLTDRLSDFAGRLA